MEVRGKRMSDKTRNFRRIINIALLSLFVGLCTIFAGQITAEAYTGAGPTVTGISIDKKTARTGDLLEVTVEAYADMGLSSQGQISYKLPGEGGYRAILLSLGSDGKYHGYISVYSGDYGIWRVDSIYVADRAGNYAVAFDSELNPDWLGAMDLSGGNYEVLPPNIGPTVTGISTDKKTAEPGDYLEVTVEAYADLGLSFYGQITYKMPGEGQYATTQLFLDNDGKYRGYISADSGDYGIWRVYSIQVTDRVGRLLVAYNSELNPQFPGARDLSGGNFEMLPPDTDPPVVKSIRIDKDVALHGEQIKVTIEAEDQSGINGDIRVGFDSPDGYSTKSIYLKKDSDGNYSAFMYVNPFEGLGLWRVYYIALEDTKGNQTSVYDSHTYPYMSNTMDLSEGNYQVGYKIFFDYQDGSGLAETIIPSPMIPRPSEDPPRQGYDFAGWYKEAECINLWNFDSDNAQDNTTLYAKWTIKTYPVVFDAQNGTDPISISADHGALLTAWPIPDKTNYVFKGWHKDPEGTSPWDFNDDTVLRDTTLYAKWIEKTYIVAFVNLDGTQVDSLIVKPDSRISAPAEPVRSGYDFAGWYKEREYQKLWNFDSDRVSQDTALYAKWVKKTYSVVFDARNDAELFSVSSEHGALLQAPEVPVRANYIFAGWFKEAEGIHPWDFSLDQLSGNMTLYAKWVDKLYTVWFDTQSGTEIGPVSVKHGSRLTLPAEPIRFGYEFAGWYQEPEGINLWDFDSDEVRFDTTLYAQWSLKSYSVAFDAEGGAAIDPVVVDHGALLDKPADPIRTGYEFAGWYQEPECIKLWDFKADPVNESIVLYAKWQVKSYSLAFDSQGGSTVQPVLSEYDALLSEPNDPVKTGYAFAGWFKEAECKNSWNFEADTVSQDTILYAKWIQAPGIPGSFSAGPAGYNGVTLSWAAAEGADGYQLWRSTSSGGSYTLVRSTSATSYNNTGLNTGTTYYYKVRAYVTADNVTAYGAFSIIKNAMPVLSVPNAAASSADPASISLSWTDVAGASYYQVYRAVSSTGTYSLVKTTGYLSFSNTGLSTGTSYYYKVRAYRNVGTTRIYGAFSAPVKVVPVPGIPDDLTAVSTGAQSSMVNWAAAEGASGYQLWQSTSASGSYLLAGTTSSTSFANMGLMAGTTYYYKVRAYKTIGTSRVYGTYSSPVSVKPVPFAPSSLTAASSGYNSIKTSWSAVAEADGYEVARSLSATGSFAVIASTAELTYSNKGLSAGTVYYYKVRAYTEVGDTKVYGDYGTAKSAVPTPGTPQNFTAVRASSTSIKLSWSSVPGASYYQIYRATSSTGAYTLVKTTSYLTYTSTALTTGRTYYYKVRAYRNVGTTKVYGSYSLVKYTKP